MNFILDKVKKSMIFCKSGFVPYYQPIYDVRSGSVSYLEVLLRKVDRKQRHKPVGDDIHKIESSNKISKLTIGVIKRAIKDVKNIPLSFNIPPKLLEDRKFIHDVVCILRDVEGADKKIRVMFEITERGMIENFDIVNEHIKKLKDHGAIIKIDDFGAGHSNIMYLNYLDLDGVKIDRAFIASIDQFGDNTLIDALIEFCQKLNLSIIAEGVETKSQSEYLLNKGVSMQQGYLLGKPREFLSEVKQKIGS